ncbi:hypothetical protein RU639_011765 [Aspergillus parasiticus]
MRGSILWASLAYLLCFSRQALADYASDYSRLCPGNNPIKIGTEEYTVSCDRTLAPSLPVQKLLHIQDPTPEECARVCEQDRGNCFGMIWSDNACFQSSDPSDKQFNFDGGVVLTPSAMSGKTPEQWQQEVENCEAKRDEYETKLVDEISSHTQKIKQMEKDYCLLPFDMRSGGRIYDTWKHTKLRENYSTSTKSYTHGVYHCEQACTKNKNCKAATFDDWDGSCIQYTSKPSSSDKETQCRHTTFVVR